MYHQRIFDVDSSRSSRLEMIEKNVEENVGERDEKNDRNGERTLKIVWCGAVAE